MLQASETLAASPLKCSSAAERVAPDCWPPVVKTGEDAMRLLEEVSASVRELDKRIDICSNAIRSASALRGPA